MASTAPIPYKNFIPQVASDTAKKLIDKNPYTDEVLLEIPLAGKAELDKVMLAAKKAQPSWELVPGAEKTALMLRVADIMVRRKDEIVSWLVKELGATVLKAHVEWQIAHNSVLEAATYPTRMHGQLIAADSTGKESRIYRKPIGVVGVISPWNFPLALSMRTVAPALAAGNTVVLKPASDTPVCGGLLIAKIFEEAGLPEGAFSVIIGSGSEIGDAFVQHPVPGFISFTGSSEVGKRIGALVAEAPVLKRMALELGGNSPFVVLDDADLDEAVNAAVFGKFLHQGQICMAINRIIVDAKLYDPFVKKFTEKTAGLVCGDPAAPGTNLGPVTNKQQVETLKKIIEQARKDKAKEVLKGKIEGLMVTPHVFADVKPDSSLAMNEIFGPIACIIKAKDEAHALEIANSTNYGLSSSVFTKSVDRGVRFAKQLEFGMTHVNDMPVADSPNAPFGGEKNSGIGRFNGQWLLEELTRLHWITVQEKSGPYPF